jgi:hypothetical protein
LGIFLTTTTKTKYMNRIDINLFEEKVGFDSYNKKMLVRIYEPLRELIESDAVIKKTWVNVISLMFANEKRMVNIAVNGYYSSIRKILKDIKVIQYQIVNGVRTKKLVKGENWDRFYSDEDWSWFITNTNCGGYGIIVK